MLTRVEKSRGARSLAQRAKEGLTWVFFAFGLKQSIEFIVSVVLARVLFPKDFGIVALAVMFFEISYIVGNLGMGNALVQRTKISPIHMHVTFLTGSLAAGVLTLGFIALSPWVAVFFGNPLVGPVMRWLSLEVFLAGLITTPMALLRRRLLFRHLSLVEILHAGIFGSSAIFLALTGHGVWSIVWASLIAAASQVVIAHWVAGYVPRLAFRGSVFASLFRFGGKLTFKNLLVYCGRNADFFVVGRYLGEASLGLYARAFTLISVPQRRIVSRITMVAFPTFSKIKDDQLQLQRWYLKWARAIAFFSAPILFGLFVTAEDFIVFVYSDKWIGMVTALRIMCLAGVVSAVDTLSVAIFEATANVSRELWIQAAYAIALFLGSLVAIPWGIEGVSLVILICSLLHFIIKSHILGRTINLSPKLILDTLRWPILCSLAMVTLLAPLQMVPLNPGLTLAISIPLGAMTYFVCMFLFARREYQFMLTYAERGLYSVKKYLWV